MLPSTRAPVIRRRQVFAPFPRSRVPPKRSSRQLGVFKEVVGRACKRAVSELMLEFDTGGNVRFEEGRPGDVWFSSCADLVKSRMVSGMVWLCREARRF